MFSDPNTSEWIGAILSVMAAIAIIVAFSAAAAYAVMGIWREDDVDVDAAGSLAETMDETRLPESRLSA